jgi:hypothetical protein
MQHHIERYALPRSTVLRNLATLRANAAYLEVRGDKEKRERFIANPKDFVLPKQGRPPYFTDEEEQTIMT